MSDYEEFQSIAELGAILEEVSAMELECEQADSVAASKEAEAKSAREKADAKKERLAFIRKLASPVKRLLDDIQEAAKREQAQFCKLAKKLESEGVERDELEMYAAERRFKYELPADEESDEEGKAGGKVASAA